MVHMVNGTQMDSIIYSRNRQFRSGVNMKTGNYGCCCNDSVFSHRSVVYVQEQPKIPTAVKVGLWAQAFGAITKAVSSVVNFFKGLFGKKKAAPVQTPTATQSPQVKPEPQGVTTPTTSTQTTVNPSSTKPAEEEEPDDKEVKPAKKDNAKKAPSSVDMKDFSGNITVHDDELFDQLGEKADIVGKTTVSENKGQGGYPVSMKVGNYNYALAKVDADGTVWYKSQNGNGQLYRLEKNADGTFGLNQHAGDDGVGIADVSKFKKSSASTRKN